MSIKESKATLKTMGYQIKKLKATKNHLNAYEITNKDNYKKIVTSDQLIDLANYGGFYLIESIDY